MFLTSDELFILTKRRQATAQIRNLKENNVPFTIDADGHPVVRRDWRPTSMQLTGSKPRFDLIRPVKRQSAA